MVPIPLRANFIGFLFSRFLLEIDFPLLVMVGLVACELSAADPNPGGVPPVAAPQTDSYPESLWIEAEHLRGVKGFCWPMGTPAMKKTAGHWGLSGPGWAAEWNQGGESGFLSIATAADDDRATATTSIDVPAEGRYFIWVRYGDWREQSEPFSIRIEQPGAAAWQGDYGVNAVIDEDNESKLYWG
ncbi:MAG: hypothetical protein RIS70_4049, partial [Planctomycetota bacterium]